MIDFENLKCNNGVFYLTVEPILKTDIYLKARTKENRILTDLEVSQLPYIKKFEWPFRKKSTERFEYYISKKTTPLDILDLGCGNGWFSHRIARVNSNNSIIGLDINKQELEQAARVFKLKNIQFVYANIFECEDRFKEKFDIITLNGSIQYFKDFEDTITLLKSYLKPLGEIHIIDSPFYKTGDLKKAKERSQVYFNNLGVPEMAKNYHHHNEILISEFEILYEYNSLGFKKWLGYKDSPFSWYRFVKN
jgi:2-polyprenyl-3-methyl-5-hydroxy-6-metoxy-1,4-benzoquinol methylase